MQLLQLKSCLIWLLEDVWSAEIAGSGSLEMQ